MRAPPCKAPREGTSPRISQAQRRAKAISDMETREATVEGTGAGRLELRLTRSLPHPDGTRLAGPLLLVVDRPLAPRPAVVSKPAEKAKPTAPEAEAKPKPAEKPAGAVKAAEATEPKPAAPKAGAKPAAAE